MKPKFSSTIPKCADEESVVEWLLAADNKIVRLPACDINRLDGDMGGFHAGAVSQLETSGVSKGNEYASEIVRFGCDRREVSNGRNDNNRKEAGRSESSSGDCVRLETSADAMRRRLQIAVQRGGLSQSDADTIQAVSRHTGTHRWSQINADVCRVVHGVSNKSHRIKALGNAQVPIQAATALLILAGLA